MQVTLITAFVIALLLLVTAAVYSIRLKHLLNLRNETHAHELAELKDQLLQSRTSGDRWQRSLKEEKKRADDLEAALAQQTKELEATLEKLSGLEACISGAENVGREQIRRSQAELSELRQRLADVERDRAKLKNDARMQLQALRAAEAHAEDAQTRWQHMEIEFSQQSKLLGEKQSRVMDLEQELRTFKTELAEKTARVDRLEDSLGSLQMRVAESDQVRVELEADLQNKFSECENWQSSGKALEEELLSSVAMLASLREELGNLQNLHATLRGDYFTSQELLQRKEKALQELEAAFQDETRETAYYAHRHMQWTLNHFDADTITFKFRNEGAKVFLVGVETDVPQLAYALETGHDLPRDLEARIRLFIRRNESAKLQRLPESFEMTVLYALHVHPIHFRIHPYAGQKIERIQ